MELTMESEDAQALREMRLARVQCEEVSVPCECVILRVF